LSTNSAEPEPTGHFEPLESSDLPRRRIVPILALATAGCLWGTGFFFGKIALTEMSVTAMVLFRFVFACIVLLHNTFSEPVRFSPREWRLILLASFTGVPVQFLIQFKGLSLTTVSHASLMVGTLPIFLAIAASLFAHEHLHVTSWVALVLSSLGAALIAFSGKVSAGPHASAFGDLLVVVSLAASVVWILISKHLVKRHSPMIVTAVVFWLGLLQVAAFALLTSGVPSLHYSHRVWFAVAAQGIFATAVTTLLWNWGLSRVPASQAGIFVNLEPLVGSILGVLLLHESLGAMAIAGGTLIIAGAVHFSYKPMMTAENIEASQLKRAQGVQDSRVH